MLETALRWAVALKGQMVIQRSIRESRTFDIFSYLKLKLLGAERLEFKQPISSLFLGPRMMIKEEE